MIIEEEGTAKQGSSETKEKSETKMSNKVVPPMSRGKYSETTTVTSSVLM